jgi:hypothetical protein
MPCEKLAPSHDPREWVADTIGDPIAPRVRILSPKERGWLEASLFDWIAKGIVEPSSAFVSCNPVFVEKKSGAIRVCIDYRPINSTIKDFEWPLPRIQDIRFHIHRGVWFARFDLKEAFYHILVPERFRPLTAVRTHLGIFQFRRMPFGLKTAPSVFQRYMDWVLRGLGSNCLWYIDDILVWGQTPSELNRAKRGVLRRLKAVSLEINMAKSEPGPSASIEFCGLDITRGSIRATPLLEKISTYEVPRTKKDRQSFLGFANYFRGYVKGFSSLAAPLYPNQYNETLSDDYDLNFQILVRACLEAVSINHYEEGKPCELFVDASLYATGGILTQDGKVIAITSQSLNQSQRKYSGTDREHLALVHGCEKFRVFIHSNKSLTLRTDHTALLNRSDDRLTPRQCRWKTRVLSIANDVRHVKGSENPADWLSRKGSKPRDVVGPHSEGEGGGMKRYI